MTTPRVHETSRFLTQPATVTTAERVLALIELNAAKGLGSYFELGPRSAWIAGYMTGWGGDELGFGDTLLEAVEDALHAAEGT